MGSERIASAAQRLAGQIDALSASLVRAGVPLRERAQLLELAAIAATHAVCLDEAGTRLGTETKREPARVTPIAEAPSLREAAAA